MSDLDDIKKAIDNKQAKREAQANKKRVYRKVTPEMLAKFQAVKAQTGNASQAVRELEPDRVNPATRAHTIQQQLNKGEVSSYIEHQLIELAQPALQRLEELIDSPNDQVATKNVHYVVDHLRGKAINRSISETRTINIETILAGK